MHAFKSVFLFSLEKYPEVGFLDCMVVLFLFSWGDFIPFSLAAAPICIPTGGAQGFPSPHILVNALYLLPAVLTGVRRYFARLWFTFPWGLVMLIIVSCFFFFCIRKSSLKDCPLTSSAHVGVALFALLMLSLWALCMFCLLTPCQIDCFPMQ